MWTPIIINYCHKVINCLSCCIITVIISQIKPCFFYVVKDLVLFALLVRFLRVPSSFQLLLFNNTGGVSSPSHTSSHGAAHAAAVGRPKSSQYSDRVHEFIRLLYPSWCVRVPPWKSHEPLLADTFLLNSPWKKHPILRIPITKGRKSHHSAAKNTFFLPRVVSSNFLCLDLFGAALLAIQILLEKRRVLRDCWRG